MQCFYLCKVAMCFLLRFRCVTFVLLSEELVWAFRGCVSDTTPGHSGKSGSTVFVLFFLAEGDKFPTLSTHIFFSENCKC